jgi:hypothetical protein
MAHNFVLLTLTADVAGIKSAMNARAHHVPADKKAQVIGRPSWLVPERQLKRPSGPAKEAIPTCTPATTLRNEGNARRQVNQFDSDARASTMPMLGAAHAT